MFLSNFSYNKDEIMTDTTAAQFGLDSSAVPDDVLKQLSQSAFIAAVSGDTKVVKNFSVVEVGETIQLNVGGVATNFIVVQKGTPSASYDDSCNGVWLMSESLYTKRAWDSEDEADYKNSDIHTYLNDTFFNLFDSKIKDNIKQVKIPYVDGAGYGGTVYSGANGLSTKVFLLSSTEVGFPVSSARRVVGSPLSYFPEISEGNSHLVAYYNGSAIDWWLRTQTYSQFEEYVDDVEESGAYGSNVCTASNGVRPVIVLPSDFVYTYYVDEFGNISYSENINYQLTDVLGNNISISQDNLSAKIALGSYRGTGAYGETNKNTLIFDFAPKLIIVARNTRASASTPYSFYWVYNSIGGVSLSSGTYQDGPYTNLSGTVFTWYQGTSALYQLNESGITYYYVALG